MKSGIVYSDKVTTVSPTYANEIQTKFYGENLYGLIKANAHKLKGIVNGIDYEINNPETDKNIVFNYNINSIENKVKNKLELQKILGLEVNPDIPMIGIVSRLVSQKGLDLISYMMTEIVEENLQLFILGIGEEQYQSMLNYYSGKYQNKVAAILTFDVSLAQQIYASSDMFLMPSLFEPCGIEQMIAMRYGSIPIVRETGGLKYTVIPFNKYTGEGNGFSFANYNAHEMFYYIKSAIDVYKNDKNAWFKIVKSAMNPDSSWAKSANEYIKTYNEIVCQRSW